MLKIKDNVDLKELKKFGFEYRKNTYINYIFDLTTLNVRLEPIFLGEKNKYFRISVNNFGAYSCDGNFFDYFKWHKDKMQKDIERIEKLFDDLIKADLVEKV